MALFGLVRDPKRPKIPDLDLTPLRETKAEWIKQAEETRERDLGFAKARLGASGLKRDSELWTQTLESIEATYQTELQRIEESETNRIIIQEEARQEKVRQRREWGRRLRQSQTPERRAQEAERMASISGDERAISILEETAKQTGKSFYMLGGFRVNVSNPGGNR